MYEDARTYKPQILDVCHVAINCQKHQIISWTLCRNC